MLSGKEILLYLSLKYEGDWRKIYDAISLREKNDDEDEARKRLNEIQSKTVTILDKDYPEFLKTIQNPPFVLYYYGNYELLRDYQKNIAVVGSRDCSEYGKRITVDLVKGLIKKYVIVSGLARGIDSIAHDTAIKNNGKTIAVLGSGIDYCYPRLPLNIELYKKIKHDFLLISEFPNQVVPEPKSFPIRNRLISAFSKAIVVPEAKNRSGTVITVNFAIQQNRDVYCAPHELGTDSACNTLIKEGAFLIESADDIG